MGLRVTFDTNVLDWACRPELSVKNSLQPLMLKVNSALRSGQIAGFYSVTMLTIEGILKTDRAAVYQGTTLTSLQGEPKVIANAELPPSIREVVGDGNVESIAFTISVQQPDRKPLPPAVKDRALAAHQIGLLALKAVPRMGAFSINDPTGTRYLDTGSGEDLKRWITTAHRVSRAIEARGVGQSQIKSIGERLAQNAGGGPWFSALDQAKDIHEERAIERTFAEWADGDALASHIAYGIDVFCTMDKGNSNGAKSILDVENRAWLKQEFGVRFMTFEELGHSLA
ncbi:hypothetical protein [Xanthomonas sp. 4461]|uniref:hypothetical protein n=1 Tax=Xanthomonas sp. 4461 TaxID=3035313 RepID=UPI0021697817|nr:hypothetical protein [Xanthomonas sp. 4461]MCS3810848.1 hypothetical protein [Xanthomonas sp. 4461]